MNEITDIRINPTNHSKYDCEPGDSWNFNKCLDIHNDIDKYFSNKLGTTITDWGGRYASFLNDIGIDHQSENGWWSKAAVDPINIEFFIKYYSENPDESAFIPLYETARINYAKIKKAGFSNHKHLVVTDAVTALNQL